MSNNPIQMHKLRQIIRLYCQGTGLKTIQQLVGTSRNTIRKYIRTLDSLGLSYDEFSSKSDGELSQLFATLPTSVPENSRKAILDELLTGYVKRLSKKGVTREMLHKEYLELHPGGYARSRFNNMINIHGHLCRPVMHLDHKAGDKMYVDFTGSKLQLTDEYGKAIDVEVFVAILGCSQLTYVEAVASQKKEDFIKACENSLHYFGGVPQAIVPDNLKSAVTKGSKYEAILNEEFNFVFLLLAGHSSSWA